MAVSLKSILITKFIRDDEFVELRKRETAIDLFKNQAKPTTLKVIGWILLVGPVINIIGLLVRQGELQPGIELNVPVSIFNFYLVISSVFGFICGYLLLNGQAIGRKLYFWFMVISGMACFIIFKPIYEDILPTVYSDLLTIAINIVFILLMAYFLTKTHVNLYFKYGQKNNTL